MLPKRLIYMPEESTPTIATEGNRVAVAYMELSDEIDHDLFGRMFAASPRIIAAITKLLVEIDYEIEQRQHGGNDEDWASLKALSDEANSILREVNGGAA